MDIVLTLLALIAFLGLVLAWAAIPHDRPAAPQAAELRPTSRAA